MNSIPLQKSGLSFIPVGVAAMGGLEMPVFWFLADTGATRTTIPKSKIIERLGYTESWIQSNKIILPDGSKPKMANNKKADVYEIPSMRISIGGIELQPERNLLTSDTMLL